MTDIEKLKIENADLEKRLADTSGSLVAALFLIADIRRAVGDSNGRFIKKHDKPCHFILQSDATS